MKNMVLKKMMYGIGLLILMTFSFLVGREIERKHQNSVEEQKQEVSLIAIVNMDEGVLIDAELVNYASLLMAFPNERFVVSGLNDAKNGIENGTYAAYIVIPEQFSITVTALENNPQKVCLEYQFNDNLNEKARIQAVSDVNSFINCLNTNIAYMYIDAILAEYHRVQDDSATILSNDNKELELLECVNVAQLIAEVEPVEDVIVDSEVQPVNLGTYTNQNEMFLESLQTKYIRASQCGKDEYVSIQNSNIEVKNASDEFFDLYESVISDTAANHALLLERGETNLGNVILNANLNVADKKVIMSEQISDMIEQQRKADEESAQEQLDELLLEEEADRQEALENLQSRWEAVREEMQNYAQNQMDDMNGNLLERYQIDVDEGIEDVIRQAYRQGAEDALEAIEDKMATQEFNGVNGNVTSSVTFLRSDIIRYHDEYKRENLEDNISEYVQSADGITLSLQEDIGEMDWNSADIEWPVLGMGNTQREEEPSITLTTCNAANEEAVNVLADSFTQLFSFNDDQQQISAIINNDFKEALLLESQMQLGRLSDSRSILEERMEDYENRLIEFDPYVYIDRAKLETYLDDIEMNTVDMMEAVEDNNGEYISYASEVYLATSEYTTQLRNACNEANSQTSVNVENCTNGLLASRQETNSQNIAMLEKFTNSLQYTRVESRDNTEVYDYIVNPVVAREKGQEIENAVVQSSEKSISLKDILIILLASGILVCTIKIGYVFLFQRKKQEEQENLF